MDPAETMVLEASNWEEELGGPGEGEGEGKGGGMPPIIRFEARTGARIFMVFTPEEGETSKTWTELAQACKAGGDWSGPSPIEVFQGEVAFAANRDGIADGGSLSVFLPGAICAPAFRRAAELTTAWVLGDRLPPGHGIKGD